MRRRVDGSCGRTVYMGVSQKRAGQDSVFFDPTSGVGALFDGHGESTDSQSDNAWLFQQILAFLKTHDLTKSSVSNLRRYLLGIPGFVGRFRDYGVSAVVFRIQPTGGIDIFLHGDCRAYVDATQRLPVFSAHEERQRLAERLMWSFGVERVDGRLNVGRTIGDELHAMGGRNVLFPEEDLCMRRVNSIDKSVLITSDGIRWMRPRLVRGLIDAIMSGGNKMVQTLIDREREDDDDASYILVTRGQE